MLINPGASIYPMTSYYLTCSGENPVTAPLGGAYAALDSLYNQVSTLASVCPTSVDLQSALAVSLQMNSSLTNITAASTCAPLNAQANSVLQQGLCTQTFQGFFIIWISQYVTAASLFVLAIVMSVVYHYFDEYSEIFDDQWYNAYRTTVLGVGPQGAAYAADSKSSEVMLSHNSPFAIPPASPYPSPSASMYPDAISSTSIDPKQLQKQHIHAVVGYGDKAEEKEEEEKWLAHEAEEQEKDAEQGVVAVAVAAVDEMDHMDDMDHSPLHSGVGRQMSTGASAISSTALEPDTAAHLATSSSIASTVL